MSRESRIGNPDKTNPEFRIERVRTIAILYPHTSFEAEVIIGENPYYFNIDVENGKDLIVESEDDLIDRAWAYTEPLDYEDVTDPKYEFIYQFETDVYKKMAEIWNRNPIWDPSEEWREIVE